MLPASRAVRAAARAARAGHAGLGRTLIAAAATRVQGSVGGAVGVTQGKLVFDNVAISDTRAAARPLGLVHGGPRRVAARGRRVVRAG
jgi:hypothetical protein